MRCVCVKSSYEERKDCQGAVRVCISQFAKVAVQHAHEGVLELAIGECVHERIASAESALRLTLLCGHCKACLLK